MSELDKIKECLDFFCRRCNEQGFYSPPLQPIVKEAYEAIAALRSEPWIPVGERLPDIEVDRTHWKQSKRVMVLVSYKSEKPYEAFAVMHDDKQFQIEGHGGSGGWTQYITHWMPLPAAPSRETATEVPVHSKSQYKRVAAQGGNPVLSRETEQRESSGIRIEGSQSPGSNPAPMHGQSKTGLTESHSGAPTLQRPEAEQESKGSGSPLIAPAQSSDHPTADPALSAEQIAEFRAFLNSIPVPYKPGYMDKLCDAALRSLTARDEGIEAAAKWHDEQAKVNRAAGLANAASISELDAISIRALKGQP